MLEIITANSEKQLAKQLLDKWRREPVDLFEQRWLVIDNHASKSWLRQIMADTFGACAGVRFLQPGSLVWDILLSAGIEIPASPQFDTRVLRWRVAACQLQKGAALDLSALDRAEETARIMDRYLHYRPEWMKDWQTRPDESDEVARCWHQVVNTFGSQHPDALLDEIAPETPAEKLLQQNLPPSIWIFNPQQLSPVQLKGLAVLARFRPVYLYLSNPSPDEFWFDIKDNHQQVYEKHNKPELYEYYDRDNLSPLLEQLGRQKAGILNIFLENENTLGGIQWAETFVDKTARQALSLAHSVSDDLACLRSSPKPCPADNSVRVHACHSRRRELEVARDDILDALQNTTIRPEEVLVLAPDINDYSEWIEAVFGEPVTDPEECKEIQPVLYWHIDRLRVEDRPQARALLDLLTVLQGRLEAPGVMDLLLHEPIRAAFGISQADIPMLEDWVRRSRVCWGIDGSHRRRQGFVDSDSNTWSFGQDRWVGGALLGGDDPELEVLETHGELEGQQLVFSGFFSFLHHLGAAHGQWQEFAKQPLSPHAWYEWLVDLMAHFFSTESLSDDDAITRWLHKALVADTQGAELPLLPDVLVKLVRETLSEREFRTAGRIGVRFQSWENACLGPARMVFVLGMNAGEFPANEPFSEYDKTKRAPRPLDRNRRLRDKNLLLNLLSEGLDRLAFSYLGFSASDNEPQPPSPVLELLVEYLQWKTEGQSPSFSIVEHRMHGFHPDYFQPSEKQQPNAISGLFSYHFKRQRQAEDLLGKHLTGQPDRVGNISLGEVPASVDLEQMAAFFRDPLAYFLRYCLPVKLDLHSDVLPDRENWQLQELDLYLAEDLLLTKQPRDTQLAQKMLFLSGLLPDTPTGRIQSRKIASRLVEQVIVPSERLGLHACDFSWRNPLTNNSRDTSQAHHVTGKVTVMGDGILVSVCAGQNKKELLPRPKDVLRHWLSHVFYRPDSSSWLISPAYHVRFGPLQNVQEIQQALVNCFVKGQQKPWPALPEEQIIVSARGVRSVDKQSYQRVVNQAIVRDYKRHLHFFAPELLDKADEVYGQLAAILGPLFECGNLCSGGLRDGFEPQVVT